MNTSDSIVRGEKSPYEQTENTVEDEINLLELWGVIWGARGIVVLITGIVVLLSIVYALLQTDVYRAEAVLVSAEPRQSNSPLAGQLGGAAALVGINLGQTDQGQVSNAIAILQSRDFINKFIHRHNLLPYLFAADWDASEHRSIIDPAVYDDTNSVWLDSDAIPTGQQAYRAFSGMFSVSIDSATGIIRVAIESPDPTLAARWVNLMVEDINTHVKERDLDEAKGAISYLQAQLASTQLVEMQRVFYQLIESQTRVVMLADVRDEYVFQVIDFAVEPDRKIAPNRTMLVMLGLFFGFIASLVIVAARHLILERGKLRTDTPSPQKTK